MADKAASVLARLKNESKRQGIQLHQLLNLFYQEEFIRRLSRSRYRNKLILKGGFLLYALSEFTIRPTVDADYQLNNYANSADAIEALVRELISLPGQHGYMKFEIRSSEIISEIKDYHGVRVNLIGYMGKTRTPFRIDFGVGDVIVPSAVERILPVILPGFEKPRILTYSLESTVAEKLDAIIVLMEATGRMKDFYDIYYLATTFDFDGRMLQEAIYETLSNRGTPYEKDSVAIISRLAEDDDILKRWDNFCKKILKYELSFKEVVDVIIDFVLPPYESITLNGEFFKDWSCKERRYI
ncbi:nucleotidyl transferase AbiEii/AbiGii toxin family protein [Syntrophaceticus schinkii]|jgi:predicted nucleotidyltransferase component of viral defense system|nr:nucleotidyl transferase AbiEii/AbiGii toxin family protein [Syntrophaceticus schinkii]MDD4262375.1 nucleotidyl transferase AbiEii/AbiGii toxin family protein [Syntrophaceticus schinkii]